MNAKNDGSWVSINWATERKILWHMFCFVCNMLEYLYHYLKVVSFGRLMSEVLLTNCDLHWKFKCAIMWLCHIFIAFLFLCDQCDAMIYEVCFCLLMLLVWPVLASSIVILIIILITIIWLLLKRISCPHNLLLNR